MKKTALLLIMTFSLSNNLNATSILDFVPKMYDIAVDFNSNMNENDLDFLDKELKGDVKYQRLNALKLDSEEIKVKQQGVKICSTQYLKEINTSTNQVKTKSKYYNCLENFRVFTKNYNIVDYHDKQLNKKVLREIELSNLNNKNNIVKYCSYRFGYNSRMNNSFLKQQVIDCCYRNFYKNNINTKRR